MNTTPPNILYITTDGHRADAAGYLGNHVVQTPNLDQLAGQGLGFRHAYASNPICTPSRATVFTGVHPLVHQVTCHQNRVPQNLPQLSELLADAGYYTCVLGHYEMVRNLSRGWHEQIDEAQRGTQLRPA